MGCTQFAILFCDIISSEISGFCITVYRHTGLPIQPYTYIAQIHIYTQKILGDCNVSNPNNKHGNGSYYFS